MKKLIMITFAFFLVFAFTGCQQTEETTDISNYGSFKQHTANTSLGYKVFPDEISDTATVNGYYALFHPVLWVNPDIQVFLSCTYSQNKFNDEITRLSELNSTLEGYNPKEIRYTDELFLYPSYYSVFAYYNTYEYALLDYNTLTILYVSMQYQNKSDINFDDEFLPVNYEEVYNQDSANSNSFDMYLFHNEDKIPDIQ